MSWTKEAGQGQTGDQKSNLCGFEGADTLCQRLELEARPIQGSREAIRRPIRRGESARQQKAGAPLLSGDNSLRDPPVPIPNTEVKPQHADSTWLETAR